MEKFYAVLTEFIVEPAGVILGLIGMTVILIGAIKGLWAYAKKEKFENIRWIIAAHVILGLDFLVGKDIIDTLLLDSYSDQQFWKSLISLTVIVLIRIIITYFTEKELKELQNERI